MSFWGEVGAFLIPDEIKSVNDYQDRERLNADLKRFSIDGTFAPDYAAYNFPENRAKAADYFQKLQAEPALNELAALKRDPSYQTPAALEVLAQENPLGTTQKVNGQWQERSDINNPVITKGVSDFQQGSQNVLDQFRAAGGDQLPPELQAGAMARARIGTDKELAGNFENVAQGNEQYAKPARESAANTESAGNLKNFLSTVAQLPITSGKDTMPFNEVSQMIQSAAAAYPVKPEVVNQVTDNLLKQFVATRYPVSGKTGRTSWTGTQNQMGDVNKDVQSTPQNININTGGSPGGNAVSNKVTITYPTPDGKQVTQDIDPNDPTNASIIRDIVLKADRGIPGYSALIPKRDKQGNVSFKTHGKDATQRTSTINPETGDTVSRSERVTPGGGGQPEPAVRVVRENGKLVVKR